MIARLQDGTLLAARMLLAASLLPTGLTRAFNVSGFSLTLAGAGVPFPNGVATAAVVVQVFGPLALIVGVMPRITGMMLAAFAVVTAVVLHTFWRFTGIAAADERTLMLADLGLSGGFLIYALVGPGAWSWQGWRAGAAAVRAPAKPSGSARSSAGKSAGKTRSGATGRSGGRASAKAAA